MIRVGIGYDVHKLVEDRKLILGGVNIPFEKGLLGHSDADCLIHAIIDSILGALAKKDIGKLFPDSDPQYKNISSLRLLSHMKKMFINDRVTINNIDATVVMQEPKISTYIPQMISNIANCLALDPQFVNIKATTEEKLGFTGNGQGIACQAVCCLDINFV